MIKIIKIADLGNVKISNNMLASLDTEIGAFNDDYSGLNELGL